MSVANRLVELVDYSPLSRVFIGDTVTLKNEIKDVPAKYNDSLKMSQALKDEIVRRDEEDRRDGYSVLNRDIYDYYMNMENGSKFQGWVIGSKMNPTKTDKIINILEDSSKVALSAMMKKTLGLESRGVSSEPKKSPKKDVPLPSKTARAPTIPKITSPKKAIIHDLVKEGSIIKQIYQFTEDRRVQPLDLQATVTSVLGYLDGFSVLIDADIQDQEGSFRLAKIVDKWFIV